MTLRSLMVCDQKKVRFTTRDSSTGSGVMLGATLLFTLLGIAARRGRLPVTGEVLVSVAFPGSLMLSMPFWLMKEQPWKAQLVIVGGTLALLVLIGFLASAT